MYCRNIFSMFYYQGLLLVFTCLHRTQSDDLPCMSRPGDPGQGHICVCNSNYCDTIGRPDPQAPGHYYHYTTSNYTPGFTRTTGTFSNFTSNSGRPDPLAPGHYYHYITSNYTPGFTRTTGTFSNFTSNSEYVFIINPSVIYQEILGFGGAPTDTAGLVLQTLPQKAQDKLMESYFGSAGIQYTFLRVPIGGTDFSPRYYTLDRSPFDLNLEHFSLQYEDLNYKIPMIKKAMDLSDHGVKVIASCWYAPEWLKTSNSSSCGYILGKYQSVWANYHVRFLEAYKEAGIDTWAITGGNEPVIINLFNELCSKVKYTMRSPHSERAWLKDYLFPQLSAANLSDVLYLTFDENRPFVSHWMRQLAEDPDVFDKVAGASLHWYLDWFSDPNILNDLHEQYSDKLIMYTEASAFFRIGDSPVLLGSWEKAEIYSHYILEILNHWGQCFVDWNLIVDTNGGPTIFNTIDSPIIVNSTSGEFYKQPMFYVLGHFSKFIQPGSRRMQMISRNSSLKEELENAYKKLGGELKKPPPFAKPIVPEVVEGLATVNPDGSQSIIISNTKSETATVRIEHPNLGNINLLVNPHSINTILYWPQ